MSSSRHGPIKHWGSAQFEGELRRSADSCPSGNESSFLANFKVGGTFVGFGFGAIQGGLFLPSAFASGNFDRLVVAEIDSELVAQIRRSGGTYQCNRRGGSGFGDRRSFRIGSLQPLG